MKKFIKSLALLTVAGAMAALTACAELEAVTPAGQEGLVIPPPLTEAATYDYPTCDIVPQSFVTFSGIVTEISPYYSFTGEDVVQVDGMKYVLLENGDEIKMFVVDLTTAVLLDNELELGMELTAYYEHSQVMIMIWPPQHRAVALVQAGEYHSMLDRFTKNGENFVSSTRLHTLAITADTQIQFQCGMAFEGELYELENRKLFVEFAEEGREITPVRITVLFEVAMHPVHFFTEEELAEIDFDFGCCDTGIAGGPLLLCPAEVEEMWNNMLDPETVTITVEGELIDAPTPFVNAAAGTIMLPLAPIAEALGYTVVVEGNEVIIAPGTMVTAGVNSFARGREMARQLSAAPEMHDGTLFVPWEFFHEILTSTAFVDYGQIYVVNLAW